MRKFLADVKSLAFQNDGKIAEDSDIRMRHTFDVFGFRFGNQFDEADSAYNSDFLRALAAARLDYRYEPTPAWLK